MNKPKKSNPGDIKKISKMDICQTPSHAIEPLLPYLNKDWVIWESACGPERLLRKAFCKYGYNVIGTDLLYGEKFNFFTFIPEFSYDIQITNMPFSIKYKWLRRSFELRKRFALLAPYETTFAKDFQKLFIEYNNNPWLIEILSPERRINFKMPNMGWGEWRVNKKTGLDEWVDSSSQMPTCWITWGLNINRGDYLRTYYVPMRAAKYDENNKEIT